jgi:O-antigen/teichoic acid export membrane protein
VLAREDPVALKRVLQTASAKLLLVFGIPVALLSATGAPLFGLVFGPTWYEAGRYGQLYGFGVLAAAAFGPIFPVLTLLERQRWLLMAQTLGFCVINGALFLVEAAGLGAPAAMTSLGLSWTILYVGLYAATMRAVDLKIRTIAAGSTSCITRSSMS